MGEKILWKEYKIVKEILAIFAFLTYISLVKSVHASELGVTKPKIKCEFSHGLGVKSTFSKTLWVWGWGSGVGDLCASLLAGEVISKKQQKYKNCIKLRKGVTN